jgi:acyl carrier protein
MSNCEKMVHAFADTLGIEADAVIDTLSYGDPPWDSVAHMAIVVALETAFDIMMDTEDVIDMSSVAKSREILGKYGIDVRS